MNIKVQENFSQCMEHCYKKTDMRSSGPQTSNRRPGRLLGLFTTSWMEFQNELVSSRQKNIGKKIDPLHQLANLGRLEIHIALSNPNINVRIGCSGLLPSLVYPYFELDIGKDGILKASLFSIEQETGWIEWWSILLLFANPYSVWSNSHWGRLFDRGVY